MIINAETVQEYKDGYIVFVPCANKEIVDIRNITVELPDRRKISNAQRRKAYVLLGYISAWWGYMPLENTKEITKLMFRGSPYQVADKDFSLSDCTMTEARLYITYLIDFCILHGIDTGEPLYKLCEDIPRYVWACLMKKCCAVCGRKAELHHVDAIGAGRNRKEIPQIGMQVLPLCRKHHNEIHNIGKFTFMKKYLLQSIVLTEEIGQKYRLTRKNMEVTK